MDRIYLVTVCEDDSSFDLLVRHSAGDHEGVARLVGNKLLSDETVATPHDEFGLNVFEFADGPGVLDAVHHTYWKLTIDPDAGDEWNDARWLKVEHDEE
jgi:hypothetical protein